MALKTSGPRQRSSKCLTRTMPMRCTRGCMRRVATRPYRSWQRTTSRRLSRVPSQRPFLSGSSRDVGIRPRGLHRRVRGSRQELARGRSYDSKTGNYGAGQGRPQRGLFLALGACRDAPLEALGHRFKSVPDEDAIQSAIGSAFPAAASRAAAAGCKAGFEQRRSRDKTKHATGE